MSPDVRSAPARGSIGPLLGLLVAAACGGEARLAPIGAIVVQGGDLSGTLEEAGLDGTALASAARDGLQAAGLKVDEGARRSYRATVDVVAVSVVPTGGPSTAEVVVDLQIEPGWAAGAALKRSGRAAALLGGPNRTGAWRAALKGAVQEAAKEIALDLAAQRKSTEALVAELSDPDAALRARALRALASRGGKGAAKAAAGRIHDPDPAVARGAIDVLVALRDPSCALPLIDAAQAGDTATTLRLIPVLEELGGADVEGYLLTLESGHADPAVRQAAAGALGTLRRAGGPAPVAGARMPPRGRNEAKMPTP